jgi:nucleotide-binding universal stress UspA family protein
LDGTAVATTSLIAGDRLARQWNAELEVLTLLHDIDRVVGIDDAVQHQVDRLGHETHVELRSLEYSVVDDIAHEFDENPNTLVVMSTDARGRSAAVTSNIAEDVLRHIRQPMLLCGPRAKIGDDWPAGPLMVCTDGSDFAESIGELGAQWSANLGLPLTLLTVIDSAKVPRSVPVASETNSLARLAHTIEAAWDTDPEAHRDKLAPINYDALHGDDPVKAIVDYGAQYDAAMIALATHGRSGMQRAVFGSVAMGVVRNAQCPVLVNRP